jgi:hypothetical protein
MVRGSSFPAPREAPQGTFLHGFLLPFSLIATTLRHPTLGLTYLRVTVVRALVVGLIAAIAFSSSDIAAKRPVGPLSTAAGVGKLDSSAKARRYQKKGLHLELRSDDSPTAKATETKDAAENEPKEELKEEPKEEGDDDSSGTDSEDGKDAIANQPWFVSIAASGWAWLAWFFGIFSFIEGIVVTISRRYDDWISHHASPLARVRPEDATATRPKLVFFDPRWLVKKMKRRIRGYIVVAAGVPLVAAFRLVPTVGGALFALGLTAWSWYWLGVFTTAKSAHAWADDGHAPSPTLIREIRERSTGARWLAPVNVYARVWARLTRGLNAPASVFERNARSFMGLALARVVLSLPGLYLLTRPVLPIAAGRLCAENDPADRFSV